MSTGGYKCVKFSWQGGRSDTPVDRVKFILNGVCDAIIGANVGWQLDTLTPTSSDFLEMPSYNATNNPNIAKILTLTYDNHVYKLGLGYTYDSIDSRRVMKPTDVCPLQQRGSVGAMTYTGCFNGCLYFSMVKDGSFGSDQQYGWIWDGNGEFLRWMPFVMTYISDGSNTYSCAKQNTSGYLYTYYILLKGAVVSIMFKCSNWDSSLLKCIVAGEIFKETGHSSDLKTFGSIGLNRLSDDDGKISSRSAQSLFVGAPSGYIIFDYSDPRPIASQIIASDGTVYSNTLDKITWRCRLAFDSGVISNSVSDVTTSPGGRWTPCYMFLQAADHDTYGVVPGDGFKGYIDSDLLRGVNPNYSYGQQLQGGDFVYLGGGFAIGWDADNEILLF